MDATARAVVTLISMATVLVPLIAAIFRRRMDEVTVLMATVFFAMLGNAFICGLISGPHDRYGSRPVWITTFALMIAAIRRFSVQSKLI
jgi:hypothetical protein